MEENNKEYYLQLATELEDNLVDLKSYDDYKFAKECVDKIFEICSYFEDLFRYEYKNKEIIVTRKLLTMFGHELNGCLGYYELGLRLIKKNGSCDSFELHKKVLLQTMGSMLGFLEKCLNDELPDKVTFYEYGNPIVYTAVYNKDAYQSAKVYRLIKSCDVKEEIARVSGIVQRGGAYYYKEMLEELNSGNFGKRYMVV